MAVYIVFILLASPAVLLPVLIWYFIRQADAQKTVRGFEVRPEQTEPQRVSSERSERSE